MAGILDVFGNYFGNPLTWVFLGLFTLVGILIGLFLRPWVGNQVMKFIPAEHRFIDLGIEEETAVSISCTEKKGMPPQRFLKYEPGYTGIVGRFLKKPITRWLGMEGTAYTWKLQMGKWIRIGKLANAVKTVWGAAFWETVPETQKLLLEESKINVTVGLAEEPLTPEDRRSVSEEDIQKEQDREASRTFWSQHREAMKGYMVNLILAAGTGFGIALALIMLGLLKIPVITQTLPPEPTPTGNQTAGIIINLAEMMLK